MKKLGKAIGNLVAAAGVVMWSWVFISWIDVLVNRPDISFWNIFKLFFY